MNQAEEEQMLELLASKRREKEAKEQELKLEAER